MTVLDRLLTELADDVRALGPDRSALFFLHCGRALRPLYDSWLAATGRDDKSALLNLAEEMVEEMVGAGPRPVGEAHDLLVALERWTPHGDAVGAVPSTGQACWICHDTALRSLLEDDFDNGSSVEYALEPVTGAVSERLHGVTQVGSGPDEDRRLRQVLADDQMERAVAWIHETVACLAAGEEPPAPPDPHPLLP